MSAFDGTIGGPPAAPAPAETNPWMELLKNHAKANNGQFTNAEGEIDPAVAAADPAGAFGALTRAEWDDFQKRYAPNEGDIIKFLNEDPSAEIARAGDSADAQSVVATEARDRDMGRRGIEVTPEQAAVMASMSKNQAALNRVGATEQARRQISDRGLQAAADMINIGKGIAGSASADMGGAGGMDDARTAADAAAKAQAKANNKSLIGSLVGSVARVVIGL